MVTAFRYFEFCRKNQLALWTIDLADILIPITFEEPL
jgi:hypothetical protein